MLGDVGPWCPIAAKLEACRNSLEQSWHQVSWETDKRERGYIINLSGGLPWMQGIILWVSMS